MLFCKGDAILHRQRHDTNTPKFFNKPLTDASHSREMHSTTEHPREMHEAWTRNLVDTDLVSSTQTPPLVGLMRTKREHLQGSSGSDHRYKKGFIRVDANYIGIADL